MMDSGELRRFCCSSRDRLFQTHRTSRGSAGPPTNVATNTCNGFQLPVVLAVLIVVAIGSGSPSRLLAFSEMAGASWPDAVLKRRNPSIVRALGWLTDNLLQHNIIFSWALSLFLIEGGGERTRDKVLRRK